MRRVCLLLLIGVASLQVSTAQAAGVISESIKAHLERHENRQSTVIDRPVAQLRSGEREQVTPAQIALEQWIRNWLEALVEK